MVVKVKIKIEKTRHGKKNDKSKVYNLSGQRNVTYYEILLSNQHTFQLKVSFRKKFLQKLQWPTC